MTTIATKDGIVASDSQATGNFKFHGVVKFNRIAEGPYAGRVFAGCGQFDLLVKAASQAETGEFQPLCSSSDEGGTYLIVGKKEVLCLSAESMIPYPVPRTHSIGSGCAFAMGAMLAGKTAAESVRIASKLCPYTGGAVRTITV